MELRRHGARASGDGASASGPSEGQCPLSGQYSSMVGGADRAGSGNDVRGSLRWVVSTDSLRVGVATSRRDLTTSTVVVAGGRALLVDPAGCEIATLAGPAEWASDDAVKLVTTALAK